MSDCVRVYINQEPCGLWQKDNDILSSPLPLLVPGKRVLQCSYFGWCCAMIQRQWYRIYLILNKRARTHTLENMVCSAGLEGKPNSWKGFLCWKKFDSFRFFCWATRCQKQYRKSDISWKIEGKAETLFFQQLQLCHAIAFRFYHLWSCRHELQSLGVDSCLKLPGKEAFSSFSRWWCRQDVKGCWKDEEPKA